MITEQVINITKKLNLSAKVTIENDVIVVTLKDVHPSKVEELAKEINIDSNCIIRNTISEQMLIDIWSIMRAHCGYQDFPEDIKKARGRRDKKTGMLILGTISANFKSVDFWNKYL